MLSTIIDWVEKYGIKSVAVLAGIVVLYVIYEQYIKYYFEKKLLDRNTQGDGEEVFLNRRRKDDLKTQEFFSNIEFKINVDIPSEKYSTDPGHSELLKDLVTVLMQSYQNGMMSFVVGLDIEWSKKEWARHLNEKNYHTISQFKEESEKRMIPDIAVKKFIVWYTPYMQQIFFYIRKISVMQNKNAVENTNTFLLLLELILMNAIADIGKFSGSFNGDLVGVEYKGIVIGDNQ